MNSAANYADLSDKMVSDSHGRVAVTGAKLDKEDMYIMQVVKDNNVGNEDTW